MSPAANAAFVESHLRATVLGSQGLAALRRLCETAQVKRFDVPALLCAASARPSHLYYVVEGSVEIIARHSSGEEFVINAVPAGGFASWFNCFMEASADSDFYASATSTLIAIPVREVRHFCDANPLVYPLIIQLIGRRMRLLLEWIGQSAMAGPAQRMAKLLHVMAQEQSPNGNSATVRMTQVRLAAMARCSRQTANSLIAELQAQGLVIAAYGRYELPDLKQLAEFAARA